jgi:hypothetical protein
MSTRKEIMHNQSVLTKLASAKFKAASKKNHADGGKLNGASEGQWITINGMHVQMGTKAHAAAMARGNRSYFPK